MTTNLDICKLVILFIIIDKAVFIKGTTANNDTSLVTFNSTYIFNFLRIQNTAPTPYMIVIGYKVMDIDYAAFPNYVDYAILTMSATQSSFTLMVYCSL